MRGTAGSLVILTMGPAPAGDCLGSVSSYQPPLHGATGLAGHSAQGCMVCCEQQPGHSLV